MKKKILFSLPILAVSASFMTGCNSSDSRIRITYGSPLLSEMVELTYSDFTQKMTYGENMIVATYDSEVSESCGCWINFQPILNRYSDEKDTIIYKMDRHYIVNNPYGLILPSGSDPTFFVTNKGNLEKQYVYNTSSPSSELFKNYAKFKDNMDSLVKEAQLMLVDIDYVQKAIFEENRTDFVLYQARSACPDCSYCTPNFLEPYAAKNNLKNKIYVVDIQSIYDDKPTYQAYKDKMEMSESANATFGYQQGVVPTFQIWSNGVLKDTCVYFNDSVAKNEETQKWYVKESYYTEERVANLKYTNTVLLGHEIPDDEIEEIQYGSKTYYAWKQSAMAKIYNPIVSDFLNMYAK